MPTETTCLTEACPNYRVKRSVLGGCEGCGAPLVKWRNPTSLEGLARFATVMMFGAPSAYKWPTTMMLFEHSETLRAEWEERHREFQAEIDKRRSERRPVR